MNRQQKIESLYRDFHVGRMLIAMTQIKLHREGKHFLHDMPLVITAEDDTRENNPELEEFLNSLDNRQLRLFREIVEQIKFAGTETIQ